MKKTHSELQRILYLEIDDLYSEAILYQDMRMRKIAERELSLTKNDYINWQGIS